MTKRMLCLVLLAIPVGCSSGPPPSPSPEIGVQGQKEALKALAGHWEGVFMNPVNGRTGSIVFDITSGGKEARGDILMIPPGSKKPVEPSKKVTQSETLRTMPRILEINFFEATGNELTGTVGTYEDIDCGCDAGSTFKGTLSGDTIQGTFRTDYFDANGNPLPGKASTTGTWKVSRTTKS